MARNWQINIVPEEDKMKLEMFINEKEEYSSKHFDEMSAINKAIDLLREYSIAVDKDGNINKLSTRSFTVECGENVEVIRRSMEMQGAVITNEDFLESRVLHLEINEFKIEGLKRLAKALGASNVY